VHRVAVDYVGERILVGDEKDGISVFSFLLTWKDVWGGSIFTGRDNDPTGGLEVFQGYIYWCKFDKKKIFSVPLENRQTSEKETLDVMEKVSSFVIHENSGVLFYTSAESHGEVWKYDLNDNTEQFVVGFSKRTQGRER